MIGRMMNDRPTVVLDFDGVIHSYTSGWQGAEVIPDQPVEGAIEWVLVALEHFDVQVFSSRSHQLGGRTAMRNWLTEVMEEWIIDTGYFAYELEHMSVREYAEMKVSHIGWPLHKPTAFLTIDDRAITFTGQWPTIEDIRKFKPWNKK